jgi:uridine phosphorylase
MMPEGDPDAFTRIFYGCEAGDVAEIVFLTPINEAIEAIKQRAEDVSEVSGFNEGFHAHIEGTHVSVFNSRIGSPLASDCTYYLRFTPCRTIIYTGLIGALQPYIRVGDLIVPTAAVRGEGASRYFIEEAYPAAADFSLLRGLSCTLDEVYENSDINIHYGLIYTTDSFAAETGEFLRLWQSRNLLGIEMETSAIYTIASLFGMRTAAVHVVSDNPVIKKTFFDPFTEADKNRRQECTNLLIEALTRLIGRI